MSKLDRRYFGTEFEVRATPTGSAVVHGHGAIFNSYSRNLGGFLEVVGPSAFNKTLADNPDVRALINHDPMAILGRTRSGTLRLAADSVGLAYEIDMPDRQDARDLMVSLERGDITQSSFAFFVMPNGDEWSQTPEGFPLRTLTSVSIHNGDVSPVSFPAYEDADSGIRQRAFASLAHSRGMDLADVAAAAERGDLKSIITPTDSGEGPPTKDAQRSTHAPWLADARALYGHPRQR